MLMAQEQVAEGLRCLLEDDVAVDGDAAVQQQLEAQDASPSLAASRAWVLRLWQAQAQHSMNLQPAAAGWLDALRGYGLLGPLKACFIWPMERPAAIRAALH